MINKVFLTGNLTRDIELRTSQSGNTIANFGIAVNESYKNGQSGEWEDKPHFFEVVMFGRRAEAVSKFINKGSKVTVEGRLHQNRWTDRKTGENRSRVEIVCDEIEFASPARKNMSGEEVSGIVAENFGSGASVYEDDDIPF